MSKSKSRYNIFTKAELVEYLTQHDDCNIYGYSPFDIMIETKMDNILKQIEAIHFQEEKLERSNDREEIIKGIIRLSAKHDKYIRLNEEYEKLYKLRFGD